ncbi:HTH domain-containing protein [Bifidobacterium cebidarum]|uniref:Transposase n=1 Tax=Bifidobacterium cebidarum TaxID=2650773 RepID=A0A6I1G820_9BIFI|nr:HTH domain-containing protein [Bifidobacterium cebidarum]KAB7787045.1 transposase [Bifidobacterium cebidarum]
MASRKFDSKEIEYLNSLIAVESATSTRIRYTDAFRDEFLRRDMAGDSPTAIFRDAGLPSSLIGAKRIERAAARWRLEGAKSVGDPASAKLGDLERLAEYQRVTDGLAQHVRDLERQAQHAEQDIYNLEQHIIRLEQRMRLIERHVDGES